VPGFVPTDADLEHYRRVRAAAVRLNDRLTSTVPRSAMDEVGTALGILREGVLVFETEDSTAVLMDCCLHDWIDGGMNLIQKYASTNAPPGDPDERDALTSSLDARYSVILPTARAPRYGIYANDLLAEEEIFIMDSRFSTSPLLEGIALATRLLPLDGFWMTGGAALPVVQPVMRRILHTLPLSGSGDVCDVREALRDPKNVIRSVRACLDAGMSRHIRMAEPSGSGPPLASVSHRPSRNAPCPCGSGKQYKRCCGKG
jgi:hypothetical protein